MTIKIEAATRLAAANNKEADQAFKYVGTILKAKPTYRKGPDGVETKDFRGLKTRAWMSASDSSIELHVTSPMDFSVQGKNFAELKSNLHKITSTMLEEMKSGRAKSKYPSERLEKKEYDLWVDLLTKFSQK